MRYGRRTTCAIALTSACFTFATPLLAAESPHVNPAHVSPARASPLRLNPPRLNTDGSLTLAGQRVQCVSVRTRLDRGLPNLGGAVLGERLLILNPFLLGRETSTVQLFVFQHECGHHHVGASELGADCWAIERGVADGWLDRRGLDDVCRSFGNAPETPTHPSARRRCANLDRCFTAASGKTLRVSPGASASAAVAVTRESWLGAGRSRIGRSEPGRPVASTGGTAKRPPRLVSGPQLLWSGKVP